MGLSASKRVSKTLENSPEFNAACDSAYDDCLNLTQHAFPGVKPYQLLPASTRLYIAVSTSVPLISRWAPSPPTQSQVDRALESVNIDGGETLILTREQFKAFAVELFKDVIVSNARGAVLRRVPVGIVGIAGLGMATRSSRDVVGKAMGVYALGVAAAVYLSLSF
ncbi:uncharacterized protein LOC131246389 [Magnolia sinica]|uniref:uncharacterized protein LOC131246389 n=1 Tax=Magnolia sinica TaxID=86752 RepID=UPI00265AC7AA|nr:uncharacterized protein LOC131246389 [Magnolia sinica]